MVVISTTAATVATSTPAIAIRGSTVPAASSIVAWVVVEAVAIVAWVVVEAIAIAAWVVVEVVIKAIAIAAPAVVGVARVVVSRRRATAPSVVACVPASIEAAEGVVDAVSVWLTNTPAVRLFAGTKLYRG